MIKFQLFLIVGTYVVATTSVGEISTNINSKLLPTAATTGLKSTKLDDEEFVKFLKYLTKEQHFTTIVILTNWENHDRAQRDYCLNLKYYMEYEKQQQNDFIPVILLQSEQQDYILHNKLNSEFLTIICIPPSSPNSSYQILHHHLLPASSQNLLYLRKNRVIIRMNFESHHEDENAKAVADIFKYCHMEHILNVIIISYQFPHNDVEYYSYFKYPTYQIKKQRWLKGETRLFPNQLRNIKGYTVRTIPDQVEPRSMVYYDKKGQQQMWGYMGHFIRYFGKSINATLKFPFEIKIGPPTYFPQILNLTLNNVIDISAALTGLLNDTYWSEFSYPHEYSSYCVMLPVETELSSAEIFLAIMNPYLIMILVILCVCFTLLLLAMLKRSLGPLYRFYWVDLLLNDKAFRAVLGLGFPFSNYALDVFVAFVFFLLFLTGLLVFILYGVFLGSYMTSPPKTPYIKNFDDLDKSNIKILISPEEYNYINPSAYQQYKNLFEIVPISEVWEQRKRLNNSFAYAVSHYFWHVVKTQQKRFSRPLFRYSKNLCFRGFVLSYLYLPLHSVYREPLQFATLNAYASGLYYYWFDLGFYELVALGRMSFADMSPPRDVKPVAVVDLRIVFDGFCLSLLCSVLIFFIEIFVSFSKKYLTRYRESQSDQYWT